MKRKTFLLILAVFVSTALIAFYLSNVKRPQEEKQAKLITQDLSSHTPVTKVPAHFEKEQNLSSLGPSLDPARFDGPTRAGYQVAREIPQTLAQIPCYCYCDRGMGHKSLFSCFKDMHAASCDICVSEALEVLQLQKDKKLTPAQIRKQIVAEYAE